MEKESSLTTELVVVALPKNHSTLLLFKDILPHILNYWFIYFLYTYRKRDLGKQYVSVLDFYWG